MTVRPGTSAPLPVDMAGLRVIVTGGAGGIGRVIADSFAARGARTFVCDLAAAEIEVCGHRGVVADMGDPNQVDGFMRAALASLGGLDVLVNNAGIAGPTAAVEDVDDAALAATLQVNLAAMFGCARHAVPALRMAGGGSIVNLSSVAGKYGFALRSPYAASKWGVIGFSRSLATELGGHGIRVNALLPGAVDGERVRSVFRAKAEAAGIPPEAFAKQALANSDLGCLVSPQDIANMALYLASPFGATITGQAISVDGGLRDMS